MQSKTESLIEGLISTFIGFIIALISSVIIFPAYGVHVSLETNFYITAWFTLVSIVRGYIVRRFFNNRLVKNQYTQGKNETVK